MFGTILIAVVTLMHIYLFWRAASVPFLERTCARKNLILVGTVLWTMFLLGRLIGHHGTGLVAAGLEFLGMTWLAVLFLTFTALLATDLVTLFGLLFPRISARLRGLALLTGLLLSVLALVQGLRPPVVVKYEVAMADLPAAMDGTVIVALADMHLGSQLGARWLAARILQVKELRPDLVVLLGDIFEGHGPPDEQVMATLRQLAAPLGIWAVPGNHEFYGGSRIGLFKEANFKLLNNNWAEISPGLVLAGVEDLTTRYRNGDRGDPLSQTLPGRPAGATILLSHTPWQSEKAAKAGVGLMLSGHTHGGQIWPFDYLVRSRYPLLEGRYEVLGMTAIVSRGTGTWGPRMRLWRPAEILQLTLRAPR